MATVSSPPSEPPQSPKNKARSNAGRKHNAAVRAGVWAAWQAHCAAQPGLGLHSAEGDAVLGLLVQAFRLGCKNGKAQARSWIEKGASKCFVK